MRSRAIAWTAGLLALSATGWGIRTVVNAKPFGDLDAPPPFADSQKAVTMQNVAMSVYREGKETTRAHVDQLSIDKSRRDVSLQGIREGVQQTPRGPVRFSAGAGRWSGDQQTLVAEKGVQLKNRDLDISTPRAELSQRTNTIRMPSEIRGRAFGGQLKAGSFVYGFDDQRAKARDIRWEGKLALAQQVDEAAAARQWRIEGDSFEQEGNLVTYTQGVATDGEIIVRAQKIVHDRKSDVLTATGTVDYFSARSDLTAEKAVIYRKEKRAVLTGNVRMFVRSKKDAEARSKPEVVEIPPFTPIVPDSIQAGRPKPPADDAQKKQNEELRDSKTIDDYPLSLVSEQIEYFYAKGGRRAVVTGRPQARQELTNNRWRHVWSFRAVWDGEADQLELFATEGKSDVRMRNSMGDDLTARRFKLSTKEDDDKFSGEGVKGVVTADEDDDLPRPTKTGGSG